MVIAETNSNSSINAAAIKPIAADNNTPVNPE